MEWRDHDNFSCQIQLHWRWSLQLLAWLLRKSCNILFGPALYFETVQFAGIFSVWHLANIWLVIVSLCVPQLDKKGRNEALDCNRLMTRGKGYNKILAGNRARTTHWQIANVKNTRVHTWRNTPVSPLVLAKEKQKGKDLSFTSSRWSA